MVGAHVLNQAQTEHVIMIADRALLEGLAGPVTLVSWRSHRVKRVVASASAAEAMGFVFGDRPKVTGCVHSDSRWV